MTIPKNQIRQDKLAHKKNKSLNRKSICFGKLLYISDYFTSSVSCENSINEYE